MNQCEQNAKLAEEAGRDKRWVRVVGAVAATGAIMASAGVGTASAHEGSFGPTTPIDAFSDHWQKYHYGKPITDEPKAIVDDPANYTNIHVYLIEAMLGLGDGSHH